MTWETGLAIYGAALATVLAGVRIYEVVMDRPRIRVKGERTWLVVADFPERTEYFSFNAVNTGKRAVTVRGCFLELADGDRAVVEPGGHFRYPLPAKLEPGDMVTHTVPAHDIARLVADGPPPRGVVFTDAAGNEYRGPFKWGAKE